MGRLALRGMAEAAGIETSLAWHLQSNHYPPLPTGSVAIAKRAIAHAHQCLGFDPDSRERCTHRVSIRSIGTHRIYGTRVPVAELIEAWHLSYYLEDMYEEEPIDDDD